MCRFPSRTMRAIKNYLFGVEQSHNRTIWFSRLSIIMNFGIALGKIGMGAYSLSLFLCINGLYNVGIGSAKVIALRGYNDSKKELYISGGPQGSYRYYYQIGIIVMFSSIMYVVYFVTYFWGGQSGTHYTLPMVVAVGGFSITELVFSLRGVITMRRQNEPILEAIKITNLVSSMISLVLMQTAIMFYFERASNVYIKFLGVLFGILSASIGLYMIIRVYRITHAMVTTER